MMTTMTAMAMLVWMAEKAPVAMIVRGAWIVVVGAAVASSWLLLE